jgi:hypothetical protein
VCGTWQSDPVGLQWGFSDCLGPIGPRADPGGWHASVTHLALKTNLPTLKEYPFTLCSKPKPYRGVQKYPMQRSPRAAGERNICVGFADVTDAHPAWIRRESGAYVTQTILGNCPDTYGLHLSLTMVPSSTTWLLVSSFCRLIIVLF